MIFSVSPPVQSTSPVHQSSPLVQSSDCRWPVKTSPIHGFVVNPVQRAKFGVDLKSYTAKKLVVLTTEWLPQLQSSCGYESFTLVLETNWIRQPEKQVPNV